ncbi:MAG: sporulation initiation factor Spo0A C-terminal domain-containing protein [Clostridia bacterium]|nr:sporulation initiation factor Spo0A C-terminal domain-containing protein [Clostridia bacterium]
MINLRKVESGSGFPDENIIAEMLENGYEFEGAFIKSEERATPSLGAKEDAGISRIFSAIGLTGNLSGAGYIRRAAGIVLRLGEMPKMKDLYAAVATEKGINPEKVEHGIRNAIKAVWDRGKIENFNYEFGRNVFSRYARPTGGEFISMLVDRVKADRR